MQKPAKHMRLHKNLIMNVLIKHTSMMYFCQLQNPDHWLSSNLNFTILITHSYATRARTRTLSCSRPAAPDLLLLLFTPQNLLWEDTLSARRKVTEITNT